MDRVAIMMQDAFRLLAKRGQGFGILVSSRAKPTDARYTLQDPSEVRLPSGPCACLTLLQVSTDSCQKRASRRSGDCTNVSFLSACGAVAQ